MILWPPLVAALLGFVALALAYRSIVEHPWPSRRRRVGTLVLITVAGWAAIGAFVSASALSLAQALQP